MCIVVIVLITWALLSIRAPMPALASTEKKAPPSGNDENSLIKIITYNDVYDLKQTTDESKAKVGGASRVARFLQETRKEDPETLVLFAGDTISPSLWSNRYRGMQMIAAHNHFQLDFACLGNHEFDWGVHAFYEAARASHFPWLNANGYDMETKALLNHTIPHAIKRVKNLTVGIFGVIYDLNDRTTGAYFTDPIVAAQEQVAILKSKGAEFIIALTHQEWEDDDVFANTVTGVDLIVGGHDHTAMIKTDLPIPYVKADVDFKSIWEINLNYSQSQYKMTYENHKIVQAMPTDTIMDHMIEGFAAVADSYFQEPVGELLIDLNARQSIVRTQESAIANFLADSYRFGYEEKSDVGLCIGGQIRGDRIIPAGVLTRGDLVALVPFGNYVMSIQITGKGLRRMIEELVKYSCGKDQKLRENGYLVHVSGVRYKYQCTGVEQGRVEELDWDRISKSSPVLEHEVFVMNTNQYVFALVRPYIESFTILVDDEKGITDEECYVNSALTLMNFRPTLQNRILVCREHDPRC